MTASEFEDAVDVTLMLLRRFKRDKKTGERHYQPPLTDKELQDGLWADGVIYSYKSFPPKDPTFYADKAWRRANSRLNRFYQSKAFLAYLELLKAPAKAEVKSEESKAELSARPTLDTKIASYEI